MLKISLIRRLPTVSARSSSQIASSWLKYNQFGAQNLSYRATIYRMYSSDVSKKTPYLKQQSGNGYDKKHYEKPLYKKKTVVIPLMVTLSVGILFSVDNPVSTAIRHGGLVFKRIVVVAVATGRCFKLYWKTLNADYSSTEDYDIALCKCHKKSAEITLKAIESNGGVFIKLGQHIGALTYLFPEEWTSTMIPLQDRCPVSSYESLNEMFFKDTGNSIEETFSYFNPQPLGTASLAQVHLATYKETGQTVAVKIQHPSLEEFVPLDVTMTKIVLNMIDYIFPDYPLAWLSDELADSIFTELDFREEAKNGTKTQLYFRKFYKETALRVPTVVWADRRILIMEYLTGCRPDDLQGIDSHNISRAEVSACLSHIFNNMIFTPGVGLHCDPHPGNMAITALSKEEMKSRGASHNFEIILYDHGLYRDVPTEFRRNYAHFWLAVLDSNQADMEKFSIKMGVPDEMYRLFSAAITGRDFEHLTDITSKRSKAEIQNMTKTISTTEGFISDIMRLLHTIPRILLLILKTNDLTRYVDEKLASPLGPERTFLIMATYCAKTVYEEGEDCIRAKYNNSWNLRRVYEEVGNWWTYFWRTSQLTIYDFGMMFKMHQSV